MKYYSQSIKGFFDTDIHNVIPSDAIELTEDEYQNIVNDQSKGRFICVRNGKVTTEEYIPTEVEIANAYKTKRKAEYPSIPNQFDMLWHMMDREEIPGKGSEWYNTILDVKNKYPKQ